MSLTAEDKQWIGALLHDVLQETEDLLEHIHSVGGSLRTQMREMEDRRRADFKAAQNHPRRFGSDRPPRRMVRTD